MANINSWVNQQINKLDGIFSVDENGQTVVDGGTLDVAKELLQMRKSLKKDDLDRERLKLDQEKAKQEYQLKIKELELASLREQNRIREEAQKLDLDLKIKEVEKELEIARMKKERDTTLLKSLIIGGSTIVGMIAVAICACYCTRVGAATELINGGIITSTTLKNALQAVKLDPKTLLFKGLTGV